MDAAYHADAKFNGDYGIKITGGATGDDCGLWTADWYSTILHNKFGKLSMRIKHSVDSVNTMRITVHGSSNEYVRFSLDIALLGTKFAVSGSGISDTTTVDLIDGEWFVLEIEVLDGSQIIYINGSEIATVNGIVDSLQFLYIYFKASSGTSNYMYVDDVHMCRYRDESYFETTDITPSDLVARWEGLLPHITGTSDDKTVKLSVYDANDDTVISNAQNLALSSGTETELTTIAQYYQSIYLRFTTYSDGVSVGPVLKDWVLRWSEAPKVINLKITEHDGETYKETSPDTTIDCETTGTVKFLGTIEEKTYDVFEYFFDYGDGSNSGWVPSDYISYVYNTANESKDNYYPAIICRDENERESCQIMESGLSIASVSTSSITVSGDYSAYNNIKYRIRLKSGPMSGYIYHIKSVSYSAPNSTITFDNHYDLSGDGVAVGDVFEIIDVKDGDSDGTNDNWNIASYKVKPIAILDTIPTVVKKGSDVILSAERSFTPNGGESIGSSCINFDYGEGSGFNGWQTSQTDKHTYSNDGTFILQLKVKDTSNTGTAKESDIVSKEIVGLTAAEYGDPDASDCLDVLAGGTYDGVSYNAISRLPSNMGWELKAKHSKSEGVTGYPKYNDVSKAEQYMVLSGLFVSSATDNTGEEDFKTWCKIWKNNVIIKFKWKTVDYRGYPHYDVQYFYGRVASISISQSSKINTYKYKIRLVYMPGIDDTYEVYE